MRINTLRLRAMIGWLGMLLPWLCAALIGQLPRSVSATFYTNACAPFMMVLGAASFLLISYRGYDRRDDLLLSGAGLAGLGVCLFPCAPRGVGGRVGTFLLESGKSDLLHTVFAATFFLLLAYNSLFLFVKGNGVPTPKKRCRNVIYRVCGVGMLGAYALLLLPEFYCRTFVAEAVALFFFGVSFLTKANLYPVLFCERGEVEKCR